MKKYLLLSITILFLSVGVSSGKTEETPPNLHMPRVWTARESVAFALENNPDSKIALKRITSARALVIGAGSRFFPEINLSSEYSQTDNPMYSFGNILNQGEFNNRIDFNDPGRTDNLDFKIQARYRFYNGGRDQAALNAAKAGEESSVADLTSVRQQLGFEVVRVFLMIAEQTETVTARESALKAIQASVKVATARYEEGTLLKADLLSLEAQEAASSEDLIQARHNLELSKRAFLNLLGLQSGEVAIDTKDEVNQAPPTAYDSSHRPELQSLNNAIRAAEARLRIAEGGRYPTMDGFASYQVDKGAVLDGSGDSWMTGVQVNFTLFDGNLTSAGIESAKANLAELKEKKIKTELALNFELQKALLEYRQTTERLSVTRKMVMVAEESARLNRIRFQEGVILSSELIDAEKRLTDARVRQSAAKMLHQTAIANLRRTVGIPQFDRILDKQQER
jgi:outer membrane protein